jgi:hypothetical protein
VAHHLIEQVVEEAVTRGGRTHAPASRSRVMRTSVSRVTRCTSARRSAMGDLLGLRQRVPRPQERVVLLGPADADADPAREAGEVVLPPDQHALRQQPPVRLGGSGTSSMRKLATLGTNRTPRSRSALASRSRSATMRRTRASTTSGASRAASATATCRADTENGTITLRSSVARLGSSSAYPIRAPARAKALDIVRSRTTRGCARAMASWSVPANSP